MGFPEGSNGGVVLAFLLLLTSWPAVPAPGSGLEVDSAPAGRASGVLTPLVPGTTDNLFAVDWDPHDGSALLAGDNGTVLRYNASTGFFPLAQDPDFTFRSVSFWPLSSLSLALLSGTENVTSTQTAALLMVYDATGISRIPTAGYGEIAGSAWAPDGSCAYLVARKGFDGALLRYAAGTVTEVLVDPLRQFSSICRGEGVYYIGGYDFDNQSASLQVFDGTAVTGQVSLPAGTDLTPRDLAWSFTDNVGLLAAFDGNLLRFDRTSATRLGQVPGPHMLSGAGWSPVGGTALVAGWDNDNLDNLNGVLYRYNSTLLELESSGSYSPLRDAAWHPSGKHALVVGENGTALRYANPNARPLCAISSPGPGQLVSGTFIVSGTCWDPDGDAIRSVLFRVDGGPWTPAEGGEDWQFSWDTTAHSNGRHDIYAKCSDGSAESDPAPRMVLVDNPNRGPEVAITSPSEGAAVAGTVQISGTASDPDAGDAVENVQVSIAGGSWTDASGTTDWTFRWDTTEAPDGPCTVKARASDGEDHSPAASRSLTVQNHGPNSPPTCAIASPASGTTVAGVVEVNGTASDADNGLAGVYLQVDSGPWEAAQGLASWTFLWNTAPVKAGSHTLSARSSDGIVNSSDVRIALTVNHPPTCTITAPEAGSTVHGEVQVRGTASDPDGDGIESVWVRVDDGPWTRAAGGGSWSFKWDTGPLASGTHVLRAKCSDGRHLSPEAERSLSTIRPPSPVTLYEPTEVGETSVILRWSLNADSNFARYNLYAALEENSPLPGLDPVVIPVQSVTYQNLTGLRSRTTYWFRVQVVNTLNISSLSNEVYATTLRENKPPVVELTASRTRVRAGATVTLSAEGSFDPDGRIVRHEWDLDGTGRFLVNTEAVGNIRHQFAREGKYTVSVRVTDNRGASGTASAVITVEKVEAARSDPTTAAVAIALAVGAAVAGAAYFRSRRPRAEETYYERKVQRPAARRRKERWPGEGPAEKPKGRPPH